MCTCERASSLPLWRACKHSTDDSYTVDPWLAGWFPVSGALCRLLLLVEVVCDVASASRLFFFLA